MVFSLERKQVVDDRGGALMSKELAKAYEPKEVEDRIYDFWLSGGYFHAEIDPDKKPYTIVTCPG